MAYRLGQQLEYNSVTEGRWIPCIVTGVGRPSVASPSPIPGAAGYAAVTSATVMINVKPNYWMEAAEQSSKLRRPQTVAAAGVYKAGDQLEYQSSSHKTWMHCKVVEVRASDGALRVDVKPSVWMPLEMQSKRLRKCGLSCLTATDKPLQVVPAPITAAKQRRALIVWNDYNWPPINATLGGPGGLGLDTAHGAATMKQLMAKYHVTDCVELCRQQCTRGNLLKALFEIGSRCDKDDSFILYYTGHGSRLPDQDGDEEDGYDETMVLVDETGQRDDLRDDDLAMWLVNYVKADRLLLLFDCCHSATLADLDKPIWTGKTVVSLSGCEDEEESLGTGKGGVFTNAMEQAIGSLEGKPHQSVAQFYNMLLQHADQIKARMGQAHWKQKVSIQCSPGVDPNRVAWPLA
eukprot:gb/GFBE01032487.1/.p1 GENE.gb/GFBE01032487.1/~~gb/GFBE01032487.1/.p1  ORF type:complete len:405 (+),score=85.76 gb/GFBE01032487.1/:1-1215(+)